MAFPSRTHRTHDLFLLISKSALIRMHCRNYPKSTALIRMHPHSLVFLPSITPFLPPAQEAPPGATFARWRWNTLVRRRSSHACGPGTHPWASCPARTAQRWLQLRTCVRLHPPAPTCRPKSWDNAAAHSSAGHTSSSHLDRYLETNSPRSGSKKHGTDPPSGATRRDPLRWRLGCARQWSAYRGRTTSRRLSAAAVLPMSRRHHGQPHSQRGNFQTPRPSHHASACSSSWRYSPLLFLPCCEPKRAAVLKRLRSQNTRD